MNIHNIKYQISLDTRTQQFIAKDTSNLGVSGTGDTISEAVKSLNEQTA